MVKRVVIFDADDTLWETQAIYRSIIEVFYNILEQQGFQPSAFHPLFNSINEELLRTFKLSPERLGQAMLATYEAMCEREGVLDQPSITKELLELAEQVYVQEPRPVEDLHRVLSALSKEFDLFFYSGGGEKTQRYRLAKLELEPYFKASFIVTQKDDTTLTSILQAYDLDPRTTWIVGNSPRFEINPGVRLGLNCIWMHTNFWRLDLEDISAGRTFVAFSLSEVPNILNYGTGFGFQGYSVGEGEAQDVQILLPELSRCKDTWVVGTSPKLDINPVTNFTTNIIWIPTALHSSDIEPFNNRVFVAFSSNGACKIIRQWSNGELDLSKVIWRLHAQTGDGGRSMINE